MRKKKTIKADGLQGLGIGVVNTNSKEFRCLQEKIKEESQRQSKKQILENQLLSLRFQMERYLREDPAIVKEVGAFL